eukprot:357650-Chlamydomonas_euryale.AAC.9
MRGVGDAHAYRTAAPACRRGEAAGGRRPVVDMRCRVMGKARGQRCRHGARHVWGGSGGRAWRALPRCKKAWGCECGPPPVHGCALTHARGPNGRVLPPALAQAAHPERQRKCV